MKTIDEFTDYSRLKEIAGDSGICIPENLEAGLKAQVEMLAFLDEKPDKGRVVWKRVSGIAAAIAVLVGTGFGVTRYVNTPKDTFNDPYLAYGQVEEAFSMISNRMEKGLKMAQEAESVLVRTNEIMEKIN